MSFTDKVNAIILKWWHFFIYKPNSREIYWGKIIPSIVVILIFFTVVLLNNKRVDKIIAERTRFARYTIGITTGKHNNIKGSMVVDYYFSFSDIKFAKSEGTNNWFFNKPNTHGGRYYVWFAINNPSNSELLFDNPVPDSIENAPDSGWANMPGYEKLEPGKLQN